MEQSATAIKHDAAWPRRLRHFIVAFRYNRRFHHDLV
jgi:hypothetical protein